MPLLQVELQFQSEFMRYAEMAVSVLAGSRVYNKSALLKAGRIWFMPSQGLLYPAAIDRYANSVLPDDPDAFVLVRSEPAHVLICQH